MNIHLPTHMLRDALAALALGLAATMTVHAQSALPEPDSAIDSALSAPATTTVDEAKLDKFANAYLAVQSLQKDAQQAAASDPAAAQQKQTELQTKMSEAVRNSGLEIDEFNTIAQALVSDVDLRERVIAKVQQRTGG